ncbi:MAG: nuclear transport factor 2 family protein [Pseudoxanthomonas sp.]
MTRLATFLFAAIFLVALSPPAHAADAQTPEEAAQRYLQAEAQFDLPALQAVLDPAFVEISPAGEVDEHDKVLSFYAPDKKIDTPPTRVEPFLTRLHGDTAVLSTRITFEMQGQVRALALGITARRGESGWKLLSAQYTGVRPKPAQ